MNNISPKHTKIEYLRRIIISLEMNKEADEFRRRCLWEWTRLSCSKW